MKNSGANKTQVYNDKELSLIAQTLQEKFNRELPKHQVIKRLKRINHESKERKLLELSRQRK